MTGRPRYLSLMLNVDTIEELPKAGRNLAKFIEAVDHPHGPFTLSVSVGAGGVDMERIALAEPAGDEVDIVFIPDNDGGGDEEGGGTDGT